VVDALSVGAVVIGRCLGRKKKIVPMMSVNTAKPPTTPPMIGPVLLFGFKVVLLEFDGRLREEGSEDERFKEGEFEDGLEEELEEMGPEDDDVVW
jgi:hypothetical protein